MRGRRVKGKDGPHLVKFHQLCSVHFFGLIQGYKLDLFWWQGFIGKWSF